MIILYNRTFRTSWAQYIAYANIVAGIYYTESDCRMQQGYFQKGENYGTYAATSTGADRSGTDERERPVYR